MFDGIDYVSHDGCTYAGYKEVIEVFGITMTPDHKLWINDEWVEGHHVNTSAEGRREAEFRWDDCGRSCSRRTIVAVPEEHSTEEREASGSKKEHVYDLVNCGPRHRFLVKNSDGEMFIAKNSMGHGVDGLQENGNILVWFGLSWSLELYEQMNGRINRQGQSRPVSIIRILCSDSVDLAVADALERKTDDQEGLKAALQRYRSGITTNDLEVNFY